MATPLQTSNTIDFNSARLSLSKPQQTTPSDSVREDYSERRYRMASSLQTTLDIELLLQLFLAELKPSVELDGLAYINENQRLQSVTGRKASHSCGYRLITKEDNQEVQNLTLSVGMAALTGTDSSSSLIDRASKALNNAKKRGGNLIHS